MGWCHNANNDNNNNKITKIITEQGDLEAHRRTEGLHVGEESCKQSCKEKWNSLPIYVAALILQV